MAVPVLLYASECWTWAEQQINRTEIAKTCFLRLAPRQVRCNWWTTKWRY